jgi:DNA primase
LGTACTNEHVQKLFRFTDSVVFSFDGDAAGRRAARKALDGALAFATDVRSIKFLFLPAEHDPDSFIREHGKDAFARYVSEATPLSRFLIESAREGCDLNTAEGRAHLSSNAKPLWMQMPDGALKLQLLAEIGELVQLTGRELTELWSPAPAANAPRENTWRKKTAGFAPGYPRSNRPRAGGRAVPASRADHATRILLGQSVLWDQLTNEDHTMLGELAEPHGLLIAWLEAQLHEHGPMQWEALQHALQGHPSEVLATKLMAGYEASVQPQSEAGPELRDLLNRMLIDRLKDQETAAIDASKADPKALDRYRELRDRRLELMRIQSEAIIQG